MNPVVIPKNHILYFVISSKLLLALALGCEPLSSPSDISGGEGEGGGEKERGRVMPRISMSSLPTEARGMGESRGELRWLGELVINAALRRQPARRCCRARSR